MDREHIAKTKICWLLAEDVKFIKESIATNEQEWVEEPQIVMGCIMAAIQHGVKERFDFV